MYAFYVLLEKKFWFVYEHLKIKIKVNFLANTQVAGYIFELAGNNF
jgi:hypothetical protein